jgi:hypothetical protein
MVRKYFLVFILLTVGNICFGKTELNVDVFWGWGGCYRPMEWMPVEVGITSTAAEPFGGTLFISAPQDGLNTMNIRHSFALTPSLPLHIPLVAKLAFASPQSNVSIVDEHDRTQWSYSFELWNFSRQNSPLTVVNEDDILIGVVGYRKFGLSTLSEGIVSKSTKNYGTVYIKDKIARMVPWDWTGFVSLDLLILYDPDWSLFNKQQLNAVAQWVSNGGKLLIILGSNQMLADNPLSRELAFEIQQARQMTISADALKSLDLNSGKDETTVCYLIRQKPDANFVQMTARNEDGCLFARARVGFGRVGILGFDPSTLSDNQNANSVQFWLNIIKSIIDEEDTDQGRQDSSERGMRSSAGSRYDFATDRTIIVKDEQRKDELGPDRNYFYSIGIAQAGNNAVMEHLYHISQLRPLSIWWVILLLIVFALLLGPIDYLVLKRFDRLPLTWVTSCCWILVFSVGAYYGVAAIRGGRMTLRVVSVLDGIAGSGHNWATFYSGLFASSSANYKLDGLSEKQWWSGLAPSEEQLYAYRQEIVGRNIYFEQSDGKNHPFSVPVNIWTMQCLLSEQPVEKMPVDAAVFVEGEKLTVKIDNMSSVPIRDGYVLLSNNRAFNFGTVAANTSKELTGSLIPFNGWRTDNLRLAYSYYSDSPFSFNKENAFFAQGVLPRTRAINYYLQHGAAAVCLEFEGAAVPFKIKGRSYETDHIQLVRLVVMPQVKK